MLKKLKKTTAKIPKSEPIPNVVDFGDNNNEQDNSSDDGFSDKEDGQKIDAFKPKTPKKRKQNNEIQQEVAMTTAKQRKEMEKIKPPTVEEITELKETRNLFHSNLFRLQVKEMLTELKIKEKYTNFVNTWLESFKSFLLNLKSEAEKQSVDAMVPECLKNCSIQVPLALKQLQAQKQKSFQFQFIKPKEAPLLIGSAATKTLLSANLVIDIAVVMPDECFQKENYLNLVYDQKRAIYLTYIATKMLEADEFDGLTIDHLKFNIYANNPLKPILEVGLPPSAGSIANKLKMRIFVVAEESSFKLSRFVPWNNNIRNILFGDEDDENSLPLATPNYNASVLFDLTMLRNQQLLHEIFETHKNFQDGLLLLKVWLQQRQLNVGFSGFHSHILAMFIVYLYKERKLHTNMSSYQVARNVWNQLACSKWNEDLKGITLCPKAEPAVPNQPTLEQFHAYYDVVFVDQTGFYNICANFSVEVYQRVRLEAKKAVEILNDMKLNSFQIIFMHKCPIYSQFDHILKINKADVLEQILEIYSTPADRCNFIGNTHPQLLKIFTTLLRKGLDRRIHSIMPIEQTSTAWAANQKPFELTKYLHLGLILDPQHAYEVLDKGPESFAEGAIEFRKFWGEHAQLRRFQDGSITEAVVWGLYSDPLRKKRLVVREIVKYLLRYHLQVETKDFDYLADQFDPAFKLTSMFKTDKLYEKNRVAQDVDAEALSLNVIHSFDELARNLHSLTELPLEIVSIGGIAPVFRYCEPEPILPQARCILDKFYANKVLWSVIQLGTSGKWPGELAALRALKTAFYIQIAKMLRTNFHYRTKVTLDGVLILKDGYVFGIEIAHQKEVALLKKEKKEPGTVLKYVDSEASIALEKRHYILPKITGALHGLYQMHPSFGPTVMIAKRWLYSQLIDDGLWPDECTELLIASQYLRMNAQQIPCQPQTGFLRFLQLLAFTDWKTELVLIDFNNIMNENSISELENRFHCERFSFPPLCIVTAYDLEHYGLVWTSNSRPNINILARVTVLARQALTILESAIASVEENFIEPAKLFTASKKGYDLVIQLKPDIVPNSLAVEFGSPFGKFAKPNFRLPLAGTNFLLGAVKKLREAYSEYAAFFYNPCGGKEIFVIWKPNVFCEKDFKVTEVNGCRLTADHNKVQCDKNVLIEDFKVILKDFYMRIDTVDTISKLSHESAVQHNNNQRKIKAELKSTISPSLKNVKNFKHKKTTHKLRKNIKVRKALKS